MAFTSIDELAKQVRIPKSEVGFLHTDTMTFSFWTFEPDVPLPEHSHPHDQVTVMLEGELDLTIDGETRRMKAGDLATIPPHSVHSAHSVTACRVMDIFHPVREDFK